MELIVHLKPHIARSRNREKAAEQPVRQARNNKAAEEIEVVDVLCADRDWCPHRASEANDVDQDAGNVGCEAAPVQAVGEVVWPRFEAGVQVADFEVAFAHPVVVADHDAGDGGQEDGVGGQVGGEGVAVAQQVPGTDADADDRADI